MRRLLLTLVFGLLAGAAAAQEPPRRPACAVTDDTSIPASLAAWKTRTPLDAAARVADAAALPIGAGVDAGLRPNGEVVFPRLPEKPGGSVSYGGLFRLHVAEAGDHQVSLGTGAWIELVQGDAVVPTKRFGPGPACASLKKTVVFALVPGDYLLEITGNAAPQLPLMVTRLAE